MSVYDLNFNKDDSIIRKIIVGTLANLDNEVKISQQLGTDSKERENISIPFYFSISGSERYMFDNFLNSLAVDKNNREAETVYNKIPRGIVEMPTMSILTSNIVNKYVRMEYKKEDSDGNLNTYSAEAFWVPVELNFDVKIHLSSIIDTFKVTEALIKKYFKNSYFNIDDNHTRVPCVAKFPTDQNQEVPVNFGFNDKKEFTITFSLSVFSSIPIFKPETDIFAGNVVINIDHNVISDLPGPTSIYTNIKPPSGPTGPWPITPTTDLPPNE